MNAVLDLVGVEVGLSVRRAKRRWFGDFQRERGNRRLFREFLLISVGTPYKENSISALARGAASRAVLDTFYTTIYSAGLIPLVNRLPVGNFRAALVRELQRRAFPGVPADKVRMLATTWDISLMAFRRLHLNALSSHFVFTEKRQFDRAMAHQIAKSSANQVVGMWGSCEKTFRVAQRLGRFTVMNYVNSHPREQNRLMRELGGAPRGHHEFIRDDVIRQVEQEMLFANLLLVPSHFVARQLMATGMSKDRIVVEPYGVDLRAFTQPTARTYVAGRPLKVLCVGMISYRKGVRDVIAAARRMKRDAHFDLMGAMIEPSLLKSLPENVTYHGVKVQAEVIAAMQAADVFVLGSVEDAFPLVVLESMATGLPVVVSDHAGGGENVVDGVTGILFPATQVDRLVSALQLLHSDPELRARMGRAARIQVEGSSSWESYAERVLDRIESFSL